MIEKKLNVKTCLFPIIFGAVAAIGCWAFVTPNDFASAGIEGVSILLERIIGWKVNYWQLVLNVPLCVFAFFCNRLQILPTSRAADCPAVNAGFA